MTDARIMFDGEISGQLAQVIQEEAAKKGVTPQGLLETILWAGLDASGYEVAPAPTTAVRVQPWTANEGCNGFHLFTVVADGYGTLIAEDAHGNELAKVPVVEVGGYVVDPTQDLVNLMKALPEETE